MNSLKSSNENSGVALSSIEEVIEAKAGRIFILVDDEIEKMRVTYAYLPKMPPEAINFMAKYAEPNLSCDAAFASEDLACRLCHGIMQRLETATVRLRHVRE